VSLLEAVLQAVERLILESESIQMAVLGLEWLLSLLALLGSKQGIGSPAGAG
jgi:hypothetical protein